MAEIVAIPERQSESSKSCAETLRELLDLAERGEILAVAAATVRTGQEVHTDIVIGDTLASGFNALLGAVTLLQHDLLHSGDVD